MLYISADGSATSPTGASGYQGGVLMNRRASKADESATLSHCLHPMDLVPFTRRPLFLIVDSNNSSAYSVKYQKWK